MVVLIVAKKLMELSSLTESVAKLASKLAAKQATKPAESQDKLATKLCLTFLESSFTPKTISIVAYVAKLLPAAAISANNLIPACLECSSDAAVMAGASTTACFHQLSAFCRTWQSSSSPFPTTSNPSDAFEQASIVV